MQEDVARLVVELSRTLMHHYEAQLAELNLTFPQAMLLHHLGDALPMNQAAGRLQCDPSNVTGIVDRLEARSLIKRKQATNDRRVKHLVLTRDGQRLRRQVDSILSSAPGLSRLPKEDQTVLYELLERSLGR
jgi:MarR family transcriptional regulator, organic hydroperoxide resistance regulator